MATIDGVSELWNDGTVSLGAAREVSMHFRARMDDGTEKWFYFGTTPPFDTGDGLEVVAGPAIRFPSDVYDVPDESDLVFDQAYEVARTKAER